MDTATARRLNRRLGYRFRTPRIDPVRSMIEMAGGRLIDLNRARPGLGWAHTTCPECGREAAFWAEPDGTWLRTCACQPPSGDAFALLAVLLAREAA